MDKPTSMLVETNSYEEDEAAIIRAAQLNPARFKPLYLRWIDPIYKYIFSMVRSQAVAEDLTAQVFLKACEQLPRYRHQGYFSAWLFTIARNTANDYFRKTSRELPIEAAGQVVSGLDPLAEAIRSDELQRLDELIRSLPEDQQELIRLRYVAGLTYQEIGALSHRSEDAIRKSLSRLISRLQNRLEVDHD